jgi:hypothetical protein
MKKYRPLAGLIAFFFVVLGASLFAQAGGRRYALVIGNAEYRTVGKLVNPVNDAQDVAAALRKLGYQVDLRLNAGNADLDRSISAYIKLLAGNPENEMGLIRYAWKRMGMVLGLVRGLLQRRTKQP